MFPFLVNCVKKNLASLVLKKQSVIVPSLFSDTFLQAGMCPNHSEPLRSQKFNQNRRTKPISSCSDPSSGWPDRANFRPIVDCWLWAIFLNSKSSPRFLCYFSPKCRIFDKIGLGYILGDFFTNSSGHPASLSLSRIDWWRRLFRW
jgi:hypothetical protein